jgi:circadian clock protein KaiC
VTDHGLSVLPITAMKLDHEAPSDRISTGIQQLDAMLGGQGFYRGGSILISGSAGTGKSSFAAHFAGSVCQKGGRCIYFAFEESADQILRNMQSIGLDMRPFLEKGLLQFHATRPTLYGLEMHLLEMHQAVKKIAPEAVILDPISNLTSVGSLRDIKLMFLRMLDRLKKDKITTLCTNLASGVFESEATEVGVSSIMDTWILLENLKTGNRRHRSLSVIKSRGMKHSQQIRDFDITDGGIEIQQNKHKN